MRRSVLHSRARRLVVALALTLSCSFLSQGKAEAGSLKAELRAAILVKILNYDARLRGSKSNIVIGVLYDEDSKKNASVLVKAMSKGALAKAKVHGRRCSVKLVSKDELTDIDVLFTPSNYGELSSAASLARKAGIPTISGTEAAVKKGAAVAIVEKNGKPKLLVSRSGSKGLMSLDSHLLRLADLVP